MALSACFGGPMLNILLGIGISGLYVTTREASHGENPVYNIEVSLTLIISGMALLVNLIGLLVLVPLNKWTMDRRIGWALVALWVVTTIVNVIVEATGHGEALS